jgi:hypothetical protein
LGAGERCGERSRGDPRACETGREGSTNDQPEDTVVTALTTAQAALLVAEIGLMLYWRLYLALAAALLLSASGVIVGIMLHSAPVTALGAAGVVLWLVNWWRSRGRRKRVRQATGDESWQLRDGLVRRMRRRRVTRPGCRRRRRGDSLRPGTVARLNQIGHLGDPDVTS